MHGRPRPPVGEPEDPEKKKAGQKRLALFSRLCNEVLERRAAKRYDAETIMLASKLLEQNPEVYTVWNYRREALAGTFKGDQGQEEARKAVQYELKLTESALRKNPKSYATWHHRKWLVDQGLAPLDEELQLLNKLQELDPRNFHAWRYRRIITAKAGIPPEQEEHYTMSLINANFSDYSAWHARTVLLPQMHAADSGFPKEPGSAQQESIASSVVGRELDLVEQATFTDPSDQSAWIYHRWLLSQTLQRYKEARPQMQSTAYQELRELSEREIGRCEALLEAESERSKCKWPILTMARLLELRDSLNAQQGDGSNKSEDIGESKERLKELYRELIEIDPLRKGYYRDALAGNAAVLVQPGG